MTPNLSSHSLETPSSRQPQYAAIHSHTRYQSAKRHTDIWSCTRITIPSLNHMLKSKELVLSPFTACPISKVELATNRKRLSNLMDSWTTMVKEVSAELKAWPQMIRASKTVRPTILHQTSLAFWTTVTLLAAQIRLQVIVTMDTRATEPWLRTRLTLRMSNMKTKATNQMP